MYALKCMYECMHVCMYVSVPDCVEVRRQPLARFLSLGSQWPEAFWTLCGFYPVSLLFVGLTESNIGLLLASTLPNEPSTTN